MADQRSIVRVDPHSNMVEAFNRLVDRDKGHFGDPVVWRYNGASYQLDADNPSGNHANFGTGTLTVQDAGVTVGPDLTAQAKVIAATIGPTAARQHTLPNVASDTILLSAATQDVSNKTFTDNLVWKSGTSFTMTLDHAATANRTVTVQDLDGTMALLGAQNVGHLLWVDNTYDIGADGATRPRSGFFGTGVRVGAVPSATYPLEVYRSVSTGYVARFANGNSALGSGGVWIDQTSTNAGSAGFIHLAGGNNVIGCYGDGSILVGSVAAGMGAGTVNVSGGLYKNGTAYTNPDYVFEHHYRGRVERFAANPGARDYPGLMELEDVDAFAGEHLHLPRIPRDHPADIFERADATLEHLESVYLHLFGLHRRLKALEAR